MPFLSGDIAETENYTRTPQFVNPEPPYDLHLSSGSPAIDSGVALPEVTSDIDGNGRPFGSRWDRGADEYTAPSACYARLNAGQVYTTVQAAVAAATSGDVVKVAGTCTGTTALTQSLTLQGAYTVTDWTTSQYGPTMLDAEGAGRVLTLTQATAPITVANLHLRGGSAITGAGVYVGPGVAATLQNNVLYRNDASGPGGALYNDGGALNLWHNTIYSNTADAGSAVAATGPVTLTGNIVASNVATDTTTEVLAGDGITFTLDYNAFHDNTPSVDDLGAHGLRADPRFEEPGVDFHLALTSTLINAGASTPPVLTDFEADPRPRGPYADIGADERFIYADVTLSDAITPTRAVTDGQVIAGKAVTFTHTLTNTGRTLTLTDTFDLAVANSDGWTVTLQGIITPVQLLSGEGVPFDLVVSPPSTLTGSVVNRTVVTATSQTSEAAFDTATDLIGTPGATLVPSYTEALDPGTSYTYTHVLTNTGPTTDSFRITANSTQSWSQVLTPTQVVTLATGASWPVIAHVDVISTASAGLQDVLTITARSLTYPQFSVTVTDTTTANPVSGDRYVATEAAGGDNTNNNCTQPSSPCATVAYAVNQAAPGDTVKVAGGTYDTGGISLRANINIVGGYNPSNWDAPPDPATHSTIVDAGGVGRVLGINVPGEQPEIRNLTLQGGSTSGNGGAIYVQGNSSPILENIEILNSSAARGGGLYLESGSLTISGLAITETTATGKGGGIYVAGGSLNLGEAHIFSATTGDVGGGLYVDTGSVVITGTRIVNNRATDGAGLYNAGGTVVMQNNFVYSNTATTGGGGGFYNGGTLTATHVTLYANDAITGGAVLDENGASFALVNAIVVSNTATNAGGGLYSIGTPSLTVDYNDVWGNSAATISDSNVPTGTHSIAADPGFVDPATGDLHLALPDSPCVDTAGVAFGLPVDIDGDLRPVNQGYDMGADELAGCLVRNSRTEQIYGALQKAVDEAQDEDTLQIYGVCRGVQPRDVGGDTLTQSVIITKPLTLMGGYNSNFEERDPVVYTTTVDARGLGRVAVITGTTERVTIQDLYLINGDGTAADLDGRGGGLYTAEGTDLELRGVVVRDNHALTGGGLYHAGDALRLQRSGPDVILPTRIISNTANHGGGLYVDGSATVGSSTYIQQNAATQGGGVYAGTSSDLTVQTTRVFSNTAAVGGGLYVDSTANVLLENSLVVSNSADEGGGFYNTSDLLEARFNTLYANEAITGGAVYDAATSAAIINSSLLISNTATTAHGIYAADATPTFDYNDVWSAAGGGYGGNVTENSGDGNVSVDPDFLSLDPASPDFLHLVDTSPVKDEGDPETTLTTDIDGDLRPTDQGPDMGADEIAGCYVRNADTTDVYGSVQVAINAAQADHTLQVAGVCRGVNAALDGGETVSQTVFITKSLTVEGGYDYPGWSRNLEAYTSTLDALERGRVVYVTGDVTVTLDGLDMRHGMEANGGAVYVKTGVVTVTQSAVYSSTATNGGALYNAGGDVTLAAGTEMYSNAATDGGALYVDGGTTQVQNIIFRDNAATGDGGAIYYASGALNVWHNVFYQNSAHQGGGLYTLGATPDVRNNIFAQNAVTTTAHALYSDSAVAYTVDYNDAVPDDGNAYNGNVTVGAHSLSVDPDFVDAAAGDFHLNETSPVLDKGDPSMPLRVDVDDELRPGHQGFDMGIDEIIGCQARIDETGVLYGSLQFAIDHSDPGQTIQVTNNEPCRGVHVYDDGGVPISQTIHVTHSLTVIGNLTVLYPTPLGGTQPAGRALLITDTAVVTFTDFTLLKGDATGLGGDPGGDAGGGLYNAADDVVLENVVAVSGTAALGGNAYNAGTLLLTSAELALGVADSGGGLYNVGGLTTDLGTAFYENSAADGAALYQAGGTVNLWNTLIYTNTATNNGGALYIAGGTANVYHDVFYHNTATNGGAIYNASTADVRNNIFDGNSATSGSAIYNDSGTIELDHNNGVNQTGELSSGLSWGSGHLSVDPQFVDASVPDFHLEFTSPLIDEGDNDVSATVDHDMDDDPRPVNTAPDIGADEIPECLAKVVSTGEIYGRIATALQNAAVTTDTVQVHGTCYENLTVDQSVTLEGGYDEAFNGPDLLSPAEINGSGLDRVLTTTTGTTVTLRYLDITEGSADDGGGLYVGSNSNARLEFVDVNDNVATNNGGGLYLASNSETFITGGAPIYDNQAADGGGVYVADGAILEVVNKQFNGNTATNLGGGMMITGTADVHLVNPGFYGNQASSGGAIYRDSTGNTTIYHGTINSNVAGGNGGGLYNVGSSMVVSATIVTSNTATIGTGSGIYAAAQVNVPYNVRWNNTYTGTASVVTNTVYHVADPRLRGPSGNLYVDSPALDAMPLGTSSVEFDRVEDPRPLICGYDIGRDEYRVGERVLTWAGPNPDDATLDPGQSITYTYVLINNSTWAGDLVPVPGTGYTETVTLTLDSSQGWGELVNISAGTMLSSTEATASIGPGEAITITAQVTVPLGTYADLFDTLTLAYVVNPPCPTYTDPAAPGPEAANPAVTRVTEHLDFIVEPDRTGAAQPGGTVTYTHTITNIGNLTDTYELIPKYGFYAGTVEVTEPPTITLAPGISETVVISVTLTEYAGHGLIDRSGLIVRSQISEELLERATTDSTEVLPEAGTRYVATNGQDSLVDEAAASEDPDAEDLLDNNCTVPEEGACRTLAQAVSQAVPGDEIWVAEGVYTRSTTLNKAVTVIGGYTTADWEAGSDHLLRSTTLDPQAGRALTVTTSTSVTVKRLAVSGHGLLNDGGRLTLMQLRLYGNTADQGGAIYQPTGALTLTNSLLHDNVASSDGGAMHVVTGTAALWHNTFYSNTATTGAAVHVFSGTLMLRNNIVATHTTSSGGAVHAGPNATTDVDYNLFYGNTISDTSGTAVTGTHSLVGQAPHFVDVTATPPNFDLLQGTPAQDTGDSGMPPFITADYADRQRPAPSTLPPDIGAYEREPSLDLDFRPDNVVSVLAGSTVTFTHTLENLGDYIDTYTITTANAYGWTVELQKPVPYTVELTGGVTTTVPVTVTVPAGAYGVTNTVVVTATSGLEPALYDTVEDVIGVKSAEWRITKTVEPAETVRPGDRLTYTLILTNVGEMDTVGTYTITDTLPDFTHFVSATPSAAYTAPTVTWITDTVVPTGTAITRQFLVTVTRPLTDGTLIVNDAYAVEGGGAIAVAHGAPVTITVDAPAALAINKAVTPTNPAPGDHITYTLTVTNTEAAYGPALGTVITDSLPNEVVYQSMGFVGGITGTTDDGGSPLVWTLDDALAVGASAQVTVTGRIASPLRDGTILTNTAGVTATNDLTGATVVHDAVTVSAINAISLSKAVLPEAVVPGGNVTYTLTLTNTGTGVPTVQITDTLGSDFTPSVYLTATTVPGGDWTTAVGTTTVVFSVTAPLEGGVYYNQAVTATYGSDVVTLTNTAPLTVSAPAWAIAKTVTPADTVRPGGPLTYTLTVTNVGVSASNGAYTITDTLPEHTHFVTATQPGIEENGVVRWSDSTAVAAGDSITRTFFVTVTRPLTDGTLIVNEMYTITGGGTITPTVGLPVTVTVDAPAALSISKAIDPSAPSPGDLVTYTLTVTNTDVGYGPAEHVLITDTLPAEVTYQNMGFVPPASGIYTDSTAPLIWALDDALAVGESVQVTVTGWIDSPLADGTLLINAYGVTADNDIEGHSDTLTTEVQATNEITVSKSVTPTEVQGGGTVTYTITLTNAGNGVPTVQITDTLAAGFTPAVFTATRVVTGSTGPVTVTFTATVPLTRGTHFNEVITATYDTGQTVVRNTAPVTVIGPAWAIAKAVEPAETVHPGELLTYTLTVTNVGELDSAGTYTITDDLPTHTHFVSATPTAVYTSPTVTWVSSDLLAAGHSITRAFVVTVTRPLTDGTVISNDVYGVQGGGAAPITGETPVTVTVDAPAALAINKAVTPTNPAPGDHITYTLTVTNTEAAYGPALGTVITDSLPNEVVYQSMGFVGGITGTTDDGGSPLVWTLDDALAVGASAQVTVTGRIASPLRDGTILTNTAGVTATNDLTGDSVTHIATVSATNKITLSKTVSPVYVQTGHLVTYTLILTNSGTGIAQVALTDTLHADFSPSTYTTTVTVPGHQWETAVNTETVIFTAQVPITQGTYYNEAITATYGSEVVTLTHTAPITAVEPHVAIHKVATPDPVQADEILTYTIRVTNTGEIPLTDVVITDTLPLTVTPSGIQTWTVSELAPHDVWTQTVPVTVSWGYSGTLINEVEVRTAEGATDVYSMTSLAEVTPAVGIEKRVDPALVEAGDPLTYTIIVTNTGNVDLNGTVTDTLPLTVTPTGVLTWTLPTLTKLSPVWQDTVVVTAAWGYSGTLTNDVEVATLEGAQAQDTVTSNAETIPGLAVAKQAEPDDGVRAGETVTYTLTVTNTGSADLHATITDTLPISVTPSGLLTWTATLPAPDGVWTEQVTVTVDADYAGPLLNEIEVSAEEGAGDTDGVTIYAEIPITGLVAENDGPTTLNDVTTLTATLTSGSNVTYTWAFGDGTGATGAVATHTYPAVGTYTAVVTASNAVDVVTATTVVTVTDVPITGLVADNDSPTLLGNVTTLSATVATGSNVTYAWAFGDGQYGSGAILSHQYSAVDTYTAVVTATNNVDVVTATTVVTITDIPITGVQLVDDSPTLLGETTTLTASVDAASNISYTLDFGDGSTPVVGTLTPGLPLPFIHTYPAEDVYTATLTVSNTASLLRTTSRVTIVDAEPITGLQAHNDGPTTLGSVTTLSATVATGTGITYDWTFGDGGTGSGAVVTHVYPAVDIYTATVTARNLRGQALATTVVSVTSPSYAIYLPLVMRSYTINAPDLVVTGITAEPQGGEYLISVTVENQGLQPVELGNNFYVDFYVDREPEPLVSGEISWGAQGAWFAVGASYTFTEMYTFTTTGTHLLYAQADTDNTVIESNNGNNTYGPISVNVSGAQQLDEGREQQLTPPLTGPRPTPTAQP